MDTTQLKQDLVRDEDLRLKPYRCTAGKLTIGVGRNLDDRGITREEAGTLLDTDVAVVLADLDRNAPWWRSLPEPAARGLANMAFNLGWPRLAGFRMMLAALQEHDWPAAAAAARDSRWARQVGARSERIATLFETAQQGDSA